MVSLAKFDMTGNGKIIFIVFISHILQKLTSVSLAEHVDGGYSQLNPLMICLEYLSSNP